MGGHSFANVDCDTCDVVAAQLDLTAVQPSPHLHATACQRLATRARAPDRLPSAVEGREDSVTVEANFPTSEPVELGADQRVVSCYEVPPAAVTHLGNAGRRAHEVSEQDGREHTIRIGRAQPPGEELFDRVEN